MKKFNLLTAWILSTLMVWVSPLAFAAFPVPTNPMEQRLNRYASYSDDFIAGRCRMNTGAGIDTKAGQDYNSACKASYMGARDEAKKYQAEESAATAKIQSLTSQGTAMCGANRSASGQKLCLDQAAANYDEAAKLKAAMSKKLQEAYEKAQKWRDSNAKALKEYQADQSAISAGVRDTSNKADTFRAQQEYKAAAETEKMFNSAPVVSAGGRTANAANGGTSDISGYRSKLGDLTREQYDAQEAATSFAEDAQKQATQLREQSVRYEKMAADTRAQAAALAPSGSDPSNSGISDPMAGKKAPLPTARPPQAEIDAMSGGGSGAKGVQQNVSGNSTAPVNESTYDSTASQTSPSSQPSSSFSPQSAAPLTAAGMGGVTAGSGVASGTSNPDPYAGMNAPVAYNNASNDHPVPQQNPTSSNFGEVLGTHDPRVKNEEPQQAEADPEVKIEEGSEKVASGSGLGGGGEEGELTGASAAPGIRGANGKPLGFSSSSGAGLQSSRRNIDKDAAAGGGFSSDLKSGAVSIAGSEMKSAMQSLAEEFGATDLDLELGDLSADEKAALAPIESGDGLRSSAVPVVGGRRTASVVQGSDGSIQDEQSVALFSRSRSAHERALKRGNLILGIKKKL